MKTSSTALVLFIMLIAALATSSAQVTDAKIVVGAPMLSPSISPDKRHVMYFTTKDSTRVECIDVVAGRKLWSRTLSEFTAFNLGRFIGNDTIFVGNEDRYEFLSVNDGSVYASLPIAGGSWSELMTGPSGPDDEGFERRDPYIRDGLGIFYFRDGAQIIDMSRGALLYETPVPAYGIRYKRLGNMMMVNVTRGWSSTLFFDMRRNKLAFMLPWYDEHLNSSFYQAFVADDSELVIFCEHSIRTVDIATGRQDAVIDIDPDDPDFLTTVIFRGELCLLVSEDDIQSLYQTKTGKLLWQTGEGAVTGIADHMVELPNDEALLMTYDEESWRMTVSKISTITGNVVWKRWLFMQDGEFKTGHKTEGILAARLSQGMMYATAPPARIPLANPLSGTLNSIDDQTLKWEREEEVDAINSMYSSVVNVERSCYGYAHILAINDSQIVLAIAGKTYAPGSPMDDYDGEGVISLDTRDGRVARFSPCPLLAGSTSADFNALTDLAIHDLGRAKALVGVHDVAIVRGQEIERHDFGEGKVAVVASSPSTVTLQVTYQLPNVYKKYSYQYWRIDVSTTPSRTMLIARSTSPNVMFADSADATISLDITDTTLAAYPPILGTVTDSSFAPQLWRMERDDLTRIGVPQTVIPKLRGITMLRGDVLLMGDSALGFVSSDGSCRWQRPWSPELRATSLPPRASGTPWPTRPTAPSICSTLSAHPMSSPKSRATTVRRP